MTLDAVSSLRVLNSSFFFNFCEALSSNLKRVEDGKELIVDVRRSFSLAFLCKTAAESAKDARSLAGSWNVVEGSDAKNGSRNKRISLCSLYAVDKVLWRSFVETDVSSEFARQFTRCWFALIPSFPCQFGLDCTGITASVITVLALGRLIVHVNDNLVNF